ncbi:MAG TPA: hypothetical protein VFF28_04615 [Candidatus Nanoarchaeia archaeon]|nr:hypothetical protein [Candidatus Nanoarchaeia archaeon]
MGEIYTIEDIIEIYKSAGMPYIVGNIIFPSDIPKRKFTPPSGNEALDVANSGGRYARGLGLIRNDSWHLGDDLEFDTYIELGVGECFFRFETFQRFNEVMQLFKQIRQAPPYYLMGTRAGGQSLDFQAVSKNDFDNYRYQCTSQEFLSELYAEKK